MRLAIRSLIKAPGFSAAVVVTLAIGLGANAALFAIVNRILLRPLPYADPGAARRRRRDARRLARPARAGVRAGVPRVAARGPHARASGRLSLVGLRPDGQRRARAPHGRARLRRSLSAARRHTRSSAVSSRRTKTCSARRASRSSARRCGSAASDRTGTSRGVRWSSTASRTRWSACFRGASACRRPTSGCRWRSSRSR